MKNSKIEWTDHTFNPWIGCTKVSPGCAHCYAETRDIRLHNGQHWGKGAPRTLTSARNWAQVLKWNKQANENFAFHLSEAPLHDAGDFPAYVRPRVFCASLADWLDDEVPALWLSDLLYVIGKCSSLDFQLLTKRPENFRPRLEAVAQLDDIGGQIAQQWLAGKAPPNVWLGTTVEDQARADERIPALLSIPAKVRFLSCEPLLGPVDLRVADDPQCILDPNFVPGIHWVICGGESGPHARPMHPDWARSLRDQCQAAGVPFLFKQWGEWLPFGQVSPFIGDPEREGIWCDYTDDRNGVTPYVRWMTRRPGKKLTGRFLDGIEHNEFPEVK